MKNVLPITGKFFLVLAGILPVLFFLFFHFRQLQIHHEMKEQLENSLVQTILIAENKVHWIKPGKEINIDGKLFDIRFFYLKNGYYHFTGLFDEEETALINDLKNNLHTPDKQNVPLLGAFFHWLQCVSLPLNHELPLLMKSDNIYSAFYLLRLLNPFRTIYIPPPRF
jgi:hypothetical protein